MCKRYDEFLDIYPHPRQDKETLEKLLGGKVNNQQKLWELERLKASKIKTSGGSIIFHLILIVLTAGLWIIPFLMLLGFRSMKNAEVDKKIKKLVREK